MSDFISQHASQLISLIVGMLGGATIGSIVTLKIVRKTSATDQGTVVDQSGSRSGGDMVGRDKITGRK